MNFYNRYYRGVKLAYKLAFVGAVLCYFFYHATTGANGYRSYLLIRKEVEKQEKVYKKLREEFDILKRKVDLLSNRSLDIDLLEERCRAILNYCYPDDIVIRIKTMYAQHAH